MSLRLSSSVWRPCWLWWLRLLMWQSADNHNNDVHKSTTSHVSVVWLMLYPAGRASPPPPLPPVSLFFPSSSFLCETICSSSSSITSSSTPLSSCFFFPKHLPLHPPPLSSSPDHFLFIHLSSILLLHLPHLLYLPYLPPPPPPLSGCWHSVKNTFVNSFLSVSATAPSVEETNRKLT